jgi:hypothetical protein
MTLDFEILFGETKAKERWHLLKLKIFGIWKINKVKGHSTEWENIYKSFVWEGAIIQNIAV